MKNWTLKPSKSRLTGWNKNRHQVNVKELLAYGRGSSILFCDA